MYITRLSILSGNLNTMDIDITPEQLKSIEEWNELIQNTVPHLSASEREFLMSGITDEEWDEEFSDEDEDDDE
jgi:7,8-dihydro-6-hydroxymethylpterin-pyrophosphokinase